MQLLGDVEMPQTCYAFRIPSGAVQAIGPLIIGSWEVSPLPIVAVGSTMNDVPITSTPGRRSTCCTMRDLTRPCTVLVMNGELAHPQKKTKQNKTQFLPDLYSSFVYQNSNWICWKEANAKPNQWYALEKRKWQNSIVFFVFVFFFITKYVQGHGLTHLS